MADRPAGVPSSAVAVDRADLEHKRDVHRYGVVNALVARGIDAIDVYIEDEFAAYWAVTAADGRVAVLTDDTESYAGWLEGPWPFVARFSGPDGDFEVVDYSIDKLVAKVVDWCA
jgi:hypothetical protein